jgi:hypothetical protein
VLKELSGFSDPITLIPRTGIQFLDFGFRLDDISKRGWLFFEQPSEETPDADELYLLSEDPETGAMKYIDAKGKERSVDHETLSAGLKEVLEVFIGQWVPLPFFRVEPPNGFSQGPENWARVRIVDLLEAIGAEDSDGNTHRITFAFDTDLMPYSNDRPYLAPSGEDTKAGRVFMMAHEMHHIVNFLGREWLGQWAFELYKEREERRVKRPLSDEDILTTMNEEYKTGILDLALYVAFLDLLADVGPNSRLTMVDTDTEPRQEPIMVDLVLDVGNSRTCGIVIESDPDSGLSLRTAMELELRDLSRSEFAYKEPFETRLEFAPASFGKDHLSPRSGRSDAFTWPTIARVGPESAWLAGRREGTGGATGMSSPKRYLWDQSPRVQSWRFNCRTNDGDLEPLAKDGIFAQMVNQNGSARYALAKDDPENLPPVQALYSRSSLMCFVLSEILLQTFVMINSSSYRWLRGHHMIRRSLRRIILTMPTAMSLPERLILQQRAKDALAMVWMSLKRSMDDPEFPEVEVEWDEASATQLVYLYTEIGRNFAGDARAFMDLIRRPRIDQSRPDSVRVASIDIGGGTTDVIVTDYLVEGQGTSVQITPDQKFREGFNLAGDDILRQIIHDHVLAPIETAMFDGGVANAAALIDELFGADQSRTDATAITRRQQFVMQVACPIGLGILSAYEQYDPFQQQNLMDRPFEKFFEGTAPPNPQIIEFVNDHARDRGAAEFDLRTITFPIHPERVSDSVKGTIGQTLAALCEAVNAYDCDVLLLSGRPSCLPAVRESVVEVLPLPPDRIIPLYRYRVGDWYPFRDKDHRINDPKTTAAVGAMIGAIARGRLPDFSFRSDLLRARSTARIIGRIDKENRIRETDVYYTGLELDDTEAALPEAAIPFLNAMNVGFRQLPIERWPATRMYVLDFADDESATRLRNKTPLSVKLKRDRDPRDIESLVIDEVEDKEGQAVPKSRLSFKLQTLDNADGYWFDTGVLK